MQLSVGADALRNNLREHRHRPHELRCVWHDLRGERDLFGRGVCVPDHNLCFGVLGLWTRRRERYGLSRALHLQHRRWTHVHDLDLRELHG
jgi:hypothetical protein